MDNNTLDPKDDMEIVVLDKNEYDRLISYKNLTDLLLKSADELRDVFYDGEIFTSSISGIDVYECTMKDLVRDMKNFKNSFIYKLWEIVKHMKW